MIKIDPISKRTPEQPLKSKEKQLLRAEIGHLLLINNQMNPSISFKVCQLATNLNTAKVKDMLQNQQLSINFQNFCII